MCPFSPSSKGVNMTWETSFSTPQKASAGWVVQQQITPWNKVGLGRVMPQRAMPEQLHHLPGSTFTDLPQAVTSSPFYRIYVECSSGLQFGEGWDPSGYVIMQWYNRKTWEGTRCLYKGLSFGSAGCLTRRVSPSVNINRQRQHCLQLLYSAVWKTDLCQLLQSHRRPGEQFQRTVMKMHHSAILAECLLGLLTLQSIAELFPKLWSSYSCFSFPRLKWKWPSFYSGSAVVDLLAGCCNCKGFWISFIVLLLHSIGFGSASCAPKCFQCLFFFLSRTFPSCCKQALLLVSRQEPLERIGRT